MASQQKIIEMIAKLRQYAEGGRTQEEQAAFAAKVRDLMDRYRISEAELSGVDPTDARRFVGSVVWIGDTSWTKHHIEIYLPQMATVVATAYACRIVVVQRRAKVYFVGRQIDRAVAVYMFDYLARKGVEMADAARKARRKADPKADLSQFNASFLHGWVCCLSERYDERRAQTRGQLEQEGQSEALVRLSNELVVVDRWLAKTDQFEDVNVASASSFAADMDAAYDGVAAALDQSLDTNGIGAPEKNARQIGGQK